MSTISSSSLFHFTRNPEYLIQILQNEFRPRYYPETIKITSRKTIFRAIPMVCFCDIPLSQVKEHIKTYGEYGIGLSKDWALKKKLSPVLYLANDSIIAESLLDILNTFQAPESNSTHLNIAKKAYVKIIRHIKNYKGDFTRDEKIFKDVIFYNEREWRYTPEPNSKLKFWLDKIEFENKLMLSIENEKASNYKLTFEPDDIKYIIVKNDDEIKNMVNALKDIKSKFEPSIVEKLTTRIITSEQIKNDF